MRTRFAIVGLAVAGTALLASCSSNSASDHSQPKSEPSGSGMESMPGMSGHGSSTSSGHGGMGGMPMSSGTGLNATVNGYTLTVRAAPMSGTTTPVTFTISKEGKAVTEFDREQTKLMHFYLIRSDLSGFQHLHPTLAPDGTWSVTPAAPAAGRYRLYVQFLPHADASAGALVLSRQVDVSGANATKSTVIAAPETTTTVDGYTVTVAGTPKAGSEEPLTLTITRNGKPVSDLQRYLDTYAHVTAIHQGDLAFSHLHPNTSATGDQGGPTLTVTANLAESGPYRMFIQFQTAGRLHTAALTISAS